MLTRSKVFPTVPVVDIARAKTFYGDVLGLSLSAEVPEMGIAIFSAGEGSVIQLYQRAPSKADHTLATFEVTAITDVVRALKAKNVLFEEFEMGGKKMVDSVMEVGNEKAAWFRDSEGNILCLHELK